MRFPVQGLWILALLLTTSVSAASAQVTSEDKREILVLLQGLADHSAKPSDVLDPDLGEKQRDRALTYFSDPEYQLSLQSAGDASFTDNDSASMPVHFRFKTSSSESDSKCRVDFVKRSGKWYFANYDFLSFPIVIIVLIGIGGIIGISYASAVLLLRSKLIRAGKLDITNRVKMFIPVFWPTLFRSS
jgi:hypothetical protein